MGSSDSLATISLYPLSLLSQILTHFHPKTENSVTPHTQLRRALTTQPNRQNPATAWPDNMGICQIRVRRFLWWWQCHEETSGTSSAVRGRGWDFSDGDFTSFCHPMTLFLLDFSCWSLVAPIPPFFSGWWVQFHEFEHEKWVVNWEIWDFGLELIDVVGFVHWNPNERGGQETAPEQYRNTNIPTQRERENQLKANREHRVSKKTFGKFIPQQRWQEPQNPNWYQYQKMVTVGENMDKKEWKVMKARRVITCAHIPIAKERRGWADHWMDRLLK